MRSGFGNASKKNSLIRSILLSGPSHGRTAEAFPFSQHGSILRGAEGHAVSPWLLLHNLSPTRPLCQPDPHVLVTREELAIALT